MVRNPHRSFPLALAGAFALSACTPYQATKNADKEVYGILQQKQMKLFGEPITFDVNTPHSSQDATEIQAISIISERKTSGNRRIDLHEAISLSIENGRDYQNQKEALYISGLDLTRARHDFAPTFGAGTSARLDQTKDLEEDETYRTGSLRSRATFDQLLRTGGGVAIDIAQDIFKFYIGGSGSPGPTQFIAARLNQPLLRGAGAVATENLTQRERNVAYAIRGFSRYQQGNVIDVATNYFRVLQDKDRVRNEYFNYRNLIAFTDRATELSRDRLARFQVDQSKQSELRAKSRYIDAVNSYSNRVDELKITLGLPIGEELFFDDTILRDLSSNGLTPVPVDSMAALEIAIARRLDLINEIDRFEDTKRRLEVAADAFKPGLNIFASVSADTNNRSGSSAYSNFSPDAYNSALGIELELPLDNLEARNDFRRARIDFERQLRVLSLAIDRINADLRAGLRGLDLARQTFEIQQSALALANKRVDAANLLLEAARAQTRDLLDARNDQLTARNAVTAALINYHVTRLNFLHDLGLFDQRKSRFWVENPNFPDFRSNIAGARPVSQSPDGLITPEELFQEPSPE